VPRRGVERLEVRLELFEEVDDGLERGPRVRGAGRHHGDASPASAPAHELLGDRALADPALPEEDDDPGLDEVAVELGHDLRPTHDGEGTHPIAR
jgi:hypothetical protein